MANYKAGDLNLSINAIADDTLKRLDVLAERLSVIEGSLTRISGTARTTTRNSAGKRKNNNDFGKSLLNIGKWSAVLYTARRLGRFMGNIVQAGSDYTETLNLWQVAMRNNLDLADKFVNKMQKAYGISTKTLMEAQAIFKNMIGSLGQISDATAYKLSEALVQMSADFSSLYNVKLTSAFEKMQSMLAGQVRPIRSAGLDMTETTLFMFYQQLGGTKTMRQLNRTEKQLLSILAVYKQMGSAGALGDMTKTLNQFANQSRMMTQYWAELKSWSGLLLKDLIDESGLLVYINAALITTTEIIKAIAKSRGLGEENFIDGLFETTEATNDEIDELQGKLLDFDKFRSLEGATASPLAIDEKLLEAITGYSSKIDQAQNAAQKLAETWLEFWLTDEGSLTKQAKDFLDTVEDLSIAIGVLVSYRIVAWAAKLLNLSNITKSFTNIMVFGLVFAIVKAIEAFKEGDYVIGIISVAIGVVLAGALLKLKLKAADCNVELFKFYSTAGLLIVGVTTLVSGISMFVQNFDKLSSKAKIWIPIIATLAGVVAALATGFTVLKGNWIGAIGVGALVAGTGLMVGTQLSVPKYANGASDIDSGTMFVAGEMGKTEAVYTGSNGKTNVANIQQMRAAFRGALMDWTKEYLDEELNDIAKSNTASSSVFGATLYSVVKSEARRRGEKFANV